MSLFSVLSKKFGSSLAKKTSRGEAKEALKTQFKRDGLSDTEATNKANLEIRKAEGKETAMRKTEVGQDTKTSKFKTADEKGSNKTLAVEKRNLKTGQLMSIKRPTDKASPTRSTENRQRIRSVSEKMYESGLKDAAKTRAKKVAAVAGAAGVASTAIRSGGKDEDKTSTATKSTERKSTATTGSKDQRVNPKDFPTYQRKTESASAFRDAFKKAKDANKKTFTFEGRTYKVADGAQQKVK
jgi:hypothetical protein